MLFETVLSARCAPFFFAWASADGRQRARDRVKETLNLFPRLRPRPDLVIWQDAVPVR